MTHAPSRPPRVILTDIEGTTGSIHFVREVLFPYAHRRLADFVAHHRDDAVVQHLLRDSAELNGTPDLDEAQTIALLRRWIEEDRKATPLKTLQGLIWADGYKSGAFQGHIYDDAAAALRDWQAQGIALYVYSSGSIAAQSSYFVSARSAISRRCSVATSIRRSVRKPTQPPIDGSSRRSAHSPVTSHSFRIMYPNSMQPESSGCKRCACNAMIERRPRPNT